MKQVRKTGFTLIELLVVIVILGVLIGLVFSVGKIVFGDQEAKQAKVQLDVIRLALDEYKLSRGDYPEAPSENFSQEDEVSRGFELLKSLCNAQDKSEITSVGSIKFLPVDDFQLGTSVENEEIIFLQDPWGTPYVYAYPRADKKSGYLLFSKGPDLDCTDYTAEDYTTDSLVDADNVSPLPF